MNAGSALLAPMDRPSALRVWLLAARPATLVAAVVPVAVGSACAIGAHGFRWGPALGALLGAMLIQIGTNFANDVYDHEKGADTHERLGPTRAVQAGLLTAEQMRAGMVVAFGLAAVAGAYLTAVAGTWVLPVGLLSIASGIAYTGGPWPLGYHGLGEVFVLVFFGFVAVCGTACAELGAVPASAWFAAIPVGALASAILVINNLRDYRTDAVAGKRTLAVRFGPRAGLYELGLLVGSAYAVPIAAAVYLRWVGALLPLVMLPFAFALIRGVRRDEGQALNARLKECARLLMLHGIAWSIAIGMAP